MYVYSVSICTIVLSVFVFRTVSVILCLSKENNVYFGQCIKTHNPYPMSIVPVGCLINPVKSRSGVGWTGASTV